MSYKCSRCGKSIGIIPCDTLNVYRKDKPLCKSCFDDWLKYFHNIKLEDVFIALNKDISKYAPIFSKEASKWLNPKEKIKFT